MLFAIYVMILGVFAMIVIGRTWLRIRAQREHAVVAVLEMLTARNLPLVRGLRAAAQQESGGVRRVLDELAGNLDRGVALSAALRGALPACSGQTIGAIRAAELSGAVPSILRDRSSELSRVRAAQVHAAPALSYVVGLMCIIPMIVMGIVVFLVPKFRDIFQDFGVHTFPFLTELVIAFAEMFTSNNPLVLGLCFFLFVVIIQFAVARVFLRRMPDVFQWPYVLLDTLTWHVPVLRNIVQARSLARQTPLIAAAVRTGIPLHTAAEHAAFADANHYARVRLRGWSEAMAAGADPAESARKSRFPTPFVQALRAAGGPDELATALDYLGDYYASLEMHWERTIISILTPTVVLLFGLFVGIVILAFYLPMIHLTEGLVGSMY